MTIANLLVESALHSPWSKPSGGLDQPARLALGALQDPADIRPALIRPQPHHRPALPELPAIQLTLWGGDPWDVSSVLAGAVGCRFGAGRGAGGSRGARRRDCVGLLR